MRHIFDLVLTAKKFEPERWRSRKLVVFWKVARFLVRFFNDFMFLLDGGIMIIVVVAIFASSLTLAQELDKANLCACKSVELGFKIDCTDKAQMMATQTMLAACSKTACQTDKNCQKIFLIAQTHHDYCLEDDLPKELEQVCRRLGSFDFANLRRV